jgi:hypothetical protein
MSEPVEARIKQLLARTRQQNERYSSAHYRQPGQPGQSGLGNRLDALEQALVMLAGEIDRSGGAAAQPARGKDELEG